jgi:hypothetical protein
MHDYDTEDDQMSRPWLNRKPIVMLTFFALVCIVIVPVVGPFENVAAQSQDQTQYYLREFSWEYGGHHWVWNLSIPATLYAAYKAVPDSTRVRIGPEDFGYFTTTQDSYIHTLALKLNETATQAGYGSYDEVNFVLAFVQNIPYMTDNQSTGYQSYPRFPVETLVDHVGDCKSHSTLFAALTLSLGFGTVYINPPDHLAIGILGNDLKGTYWTYNDDNYYYCETTGVGFKIGDLPQEFDGQTAKVFPIDQTLQYLPNLDGITFTNPDPYPTTTAATPTPTSAPTNQPNPLTSPSVAAPTAQTALPISGIISEAPILFIIVVAAVAICIVFAVRSVRTPKEQPTPETVQTQPTIAETESSDTEENKFCIFCGSGNKGYAAYCEKCGKKIA